MNSAPRIPKIAPEAPTVTSFGLRSRAPGRARETGDEVDQREAGAAERRLDGLAEPPERQHVHPQMDRAVVEERGGDQPIPLAVLEADQADALERRARVHGDELMADVAAVDDQRAVLEDPAGVAR